EDGIRDSSVTGVQTCALPIYRRRPRARASDARRDAHAAREGLRGRIGDAAVGRATEPADAADARELRGGPARPALRPRDARRCRSEERRVGKEGKSRGWRGEW